MKLGFIGTGTISEAIINGIVSSGKKIDSITVSPRNAGTAAKLANIHAVVRIAPDNQAVVDDSDMLFITVRPQVVEEVLRPLRFRKRQGVVSLVATTLAASLRGWIDEDVVLTQAIPLPFVAKRQGVTAVFPPTPEVLDFFSAVGTVMAVKSQADFDLAGVASALMGTYFGFIEGTVDWLIEQGMPASTARAYVGPLFVSLSEAAFESADTPLSALRTAYSTRGGINGQMFSDFVTLGGFDALHGAFANVLLRIRGA